MQIDSNMEIPMNSVNKIKFNLNDEDRHDFYNAIFNCKLLNKIYPGV